MSKFNILVIEDEKNICDFITKTLLLTVITPSLSLPEVPLFLSLLPCVRMSFFWI